MQPTLNLTISVVGMDRLDTPIKSKSDISEALKAHISNILKSNRTFQTPYKELRHFRPLKERADIFMNELDSIKRVNKILVQIAENQDQLKRLNELNDQWATNCQQLEKGFIKVPFTKYRLFDDLGIVKHRIPTLLERDRQLVGSYNKLLKQFKELAAFIDEEIGQLAADNKITVTGNCFDKLSQIIKALDIGERPYIPD